MNSQNAVLGRGKNLTNQLECLIVVNTSANKKINKPGCLVVKTFLMIFFFH